MGSKPTAIAPDNTHFVVLSFEGPDRYSLAGGLGVRVSNLCESLAASGYQTHLIFIGDPKHPGEEMRDEGKLVLHRWCQWISDYYPDGVYQGENEKLYDFNESVPWFVCDKIVKPALEQNKLVVVLGEEWHTAEAMCRISDLLHSNGLRDRAVMFWNANNTMSFDRINWGRLAYTTRITTVSRYMKHIMSRMGIDPLVIPNGIPNSLLGRVSSQAAGYLRKSIDAELVLAKVARWDPDKRWNMAVEAMARLKAKGKKAVLLARGGIEPHGQEVLYNARSLGLKVKDVMTQGNTFADYIRAIQQGDGADVLNLRFHCPHSLLKLVYHVSDAVLANSGHEPFGLVGLETMAAGGIAFTGSTGEDYAIPYRNAMVMETADPKEIETYIGYLDRHPEERRRMRLAGRVTAAQYVWEKVIKNLIRKLEYQALLQGLLSLTRSTHSQYHDESQGPPPEQLPLPLAFGSS
ncbi:MAG: glycosyltransferase family 4 protein [Dehalococcoidia bacterium]|nr:glycosyltransferase family 4 protein [Dehalococcoidia bacterium]